MTWHVIWPLFELWPTVNSFVIFSFVLKRFHAGNQTWTRTWTKSSHIICYEKPKSKRSQKEIIDFIFIKYFAKNSASQMILNSSHLTSLWSNSLWGPGFGQVFHVSSESLNSQLNSNFDVDEKWRIHRWREEKLSTGAVEIKSILLRSFALWWPKQDYIITAIVCAVFVKQGRFFIGEGEGARCCSCPPGLEVGGIDWIELLLQTGNDLGSQYIY